MVRHTDGATRHQDAVWTAADQRRLKVSARAHSARRSSQPLIGDWNVSVPSEKEIVDSSFNSWIAHKRLAIVHEIYAGHSLTAYNRLKSVITDKEVRVNKKFIPEYEIEVAIHVFACSNSLRALKLDDTDRRWLVRESHGGDRNSKSTGVPFIVGSTPTA